MGHQFHFLEGYQSRGKYKYTKMFIVVLFVIFQIRSNSNKLTTEAWVDDTDTL